MLVLYYFFVLSVKFCIINNLLLEFVYFFVYRIFGKFVIGFYI